MHKTSFGLTALLALVVTFIQPASVQAEPGLDQLKVYNPNPYANSIILVSGKYHTLIPKGSILNLPERHKRRIVSEPTGDFIMLKKFISKNYAWISTQEVTFQQSRGVKPISESLTKSMSESGRVIVATLRKNPISVLPPVDEETP